MRVSGSPNRAMMSLPPKRVSVEMRSSTMVSTIRPLARATDAVRIGEVVHERRLAVGPGGTSRSCGPQNPAAAGTSTTAPGPLHWIGSGGIDSRASSLSSSSTRLEIAALERVDEAVDDGGLVR